MCFNKELWLIATVAVVLHKITYLRHPNPFFCINIWFWVLGFKNLENDSIQQNFNYLEVLYYFIGIWTFNVSSNQLETFIWYDLIIRSGWINWILANWKPGFPGCPCLPRAVFPCLPRTAFPCLPRTVWSTRTGRVGRLSNRRALTRSDCHGLFPGNYSGLFPTITAGCFVFQVVAAGCLNIVKNRPPILI